MWHLHNPQAINKAGHPLLQLVGYIINRKRDIS